MSHDRVRIAYFVGGFSRPCGHAFDGGISSEHDRAQFDVVAVRSAPIRPPTRARVSKGAFERFIDVRRLRDDEDREALARPRNRHRHRFEGFTTMRAQAFRVPAGADSGESSGLSGTMGAPTSTDIIVDPIVVPHDQRLAYAEKIVYLPNCYQVNDAKRLIARCARRRAAKRRCRNGLRLCLFNNDHKITPNDVRCLDALCCADIDGSVLWLFEGNAAAPVNLRREAANRGVAPSELCPRRRCRSPITSPAIGLPIRFWTRSHGMRTRRRAMRCRPAFHS